MAVLLLVAEQMLPVCAEAAPLLETASGRSAILSRLEETSGAAAYFNPALLSFGSSQVEAGLLLVTTRLSLRLMDRPPGTDITERVFRARRLLPDGTTARLEMRLQAVTPGLRIS